MDPWWCITILDRGDPTEVSARTQRTGRPARLAPPAADAFARPHDLIVHPHALASCMVSTAIICITSTHQVHVRMLTSGGVCQLGMQCTRAGGRGSALAHLEHHFWSWRWAREKARREGLTDTIIHQLSVTLVRPALLSRPTAAMADVCGVRERQ